MTYLTYLYTLAQHLGRARVLLQFGDEKRFSGELHRRGHDLPGCSVKKKKRPSLYTLLLLFIL